MSLDGRVTNRSSEEGLQLHEPRCDSLNRADEVCWNSHVQPTHTHTTRSTGLILASGNKVIHHLFVIDCLTLDRSTEQLLIFFIGSVLEKRIQLMHVCLVCLEGASFR